MNTYLFKIFFNVITIVTCSAYTDITDKEISFTVEVGRENKDGSIVIPINLKKGLSKREQNNLKVKVVQKNSAGKQLCPPDDNVKIDSKSDKRFEITFRPCEPIEKKLNLTDATQRYSIDVSLILKGVESKPQGVKVTIDLRKSYPALFKASPVQVVPPSTTDKLKGEEKRNAEKVATPSSNATQSTANASTPDNKDAVSDKPVMQLEEFEFKGCHYLKLMIPSVSELKRADVAVLQQHKDGRSPYQISPNYIEIHKENDSLYALYFVPDDDAAKYKMKFTVKIKDKEYVTPDKRIDLKQFANSNDCFSQIKEYFMSKQQPPKTLPDAGFNFKYLLIPFVIILLGGISYYAIMQYQQRKSNETKPAIKAPVATVLPATNPEGEIKFFEPGSSGSSSPVNITMLSKYTKLADLENYYNDSAVANVFIEKEAAKEIFDFVWTSQKTRPAPEVGGFLMGKVQSNPERPGLYDVYINAFLKDMAPDFQNNVNISFSDGIAADELDYIDSHRGEEKVGWLHTHPGHGVFLSPTDIGSHFRAFPRATQMAIVIESYDNFKTGIFSYKAGAKELNNISDKSTTIEYKSWKEFI